MILLVIQMNLVVLVMNHQIVITLLIEGKIMRTLAVKKKLYQLIVVLINPIKMILTYKMKWQILNKIEEIVR
jgi:hypothetical protein